MGILGVHSQRLLANFMMNRIKICCKLSSLYLIFINVTRKNTCQESSIIFFSGKIFGGA